MCRCDAGWAAPFDPIRFAYERADFAAHGAVRALRQSLTLSASGRAIVDFFRAGCWLVGLPLIMWGLPKDPPLTDKTSVPPRPLARKPPADCLQDVTDPGPGSSG